MLYYRRNAGKVSMGRRLWALWRVLTALGFVFLAVGCAGSGTASDNDEHGGFYGGISGGGTWP
jgi:hypothetical protein